MNFAHPFRLAAAASAFLTWSAFAGGPIPREDFLGAIADPTIREYVAEHFDLAGEGRALRAGRRMPNAGQRIPPFEIVGHAREDLETPVVLHLDRNPAEQVMIIPCAESIHYGPRCR